MTSPSGTSIATCPACGSTATHLIKPQLYGDCALLRCDACGSELLSPQPSDARLTEIYGPDYYYDNYAYGDNCYWLRQQAYATGSPYWWSRYNACIGYY